MQFLNTFAIKSIATLNLAKSKLASNEDGASSVEWVLIVAALAAVVGLGAVLVGNWFTTEVNCIPGVSASAIANGKCN